MTVEAGDVGGAKKPDDENDKFRKGQLPGDPFEGLQPMKTPTTTNPTTTTPPPARGTGSTTANGYAASAATTEPDDTWPELVSFDVRLPPFPTSVYEPRMRGYVEAVARQLRVPPDMAGAFALAVLSSTCAQRFRVQVEPKWHEPTNLWLLVTAPPGSGKSPTRDLLTAPLDAFSRELREEHGPRVARELAARRIKENKLTKLERKASDAANVTDAENWTGEAQSLAEELTRTPAPEVPTLLCKDITPERLTPLATANGGRIAMLSDEAGSLFDMMSGRYSGGKPVIDPYLALYGGSDMPVHRVGREADGSGGLMTVGLMAQPGQLQDLAKSWWWRERGIAGRFLFCAAPDPGCRDLKTPATSMPDGVEENYHRMIRALLDLPVAPGAGSTVLQMHEQAYAAFQDFRQEIEERVQPSGDLKAVETWARKLDARVARIAGVLHVARAMERGTSATNPIDLHTVMNAIVLGRYFIDHALAAFTEMHMDVATGKAKQVVDWLVDKRLPRVSETAAHQSLKGRPAFRTAESFAAVLVDLESRGYIKREDPPPREPGKSGAPRKRTIVVRPELLALRGGPDEEAF